MVSIYHGHGGELEFRPHELSAWQVLFVIVEQVVTMVVRVNLGGHGVVKREGVIPTSFIIKDTWGWGLVGGGFPFHAPGHVAPSAQWQWGASIGERVETLLIASGGCWVGGKEEAVGGRQPIISEGVSGWFVVHEGEIQEILLQFSMCCCSPSDAPLEGLSKVLGFDGLVVPSAPAESAGLLKMLVLKGNYTPLYVYTLTVGLGALIVPVLSLFLAIVADVGDWLLSVGDQGQGRTRILLIKHGGLMVGASQVPSCVVSTGWDEDRGGLFDDGGGQECTSHGGESRWGFQVGWSE